MEGQEISARSFCFFKNLMQPGCSDYPVDSICDGCRYHETLVPVTVKICEHLF